MCCTISSAERISVRLCHTNYRICDESIEQEAALDSGHNSDILPSYYRVELPPEPPHIYSYKKLQSRMDVLFTNASNGGVTERRRPAAKLKAPLANKRTTVVGLSKLLGYVDCIGQYAIKLPGYAMIWDIPLVSKMTAENMSSQIAKGYQRALQILIEISWKEFNARSSVKRKPAKYFNKEDIAVILRMEELIRYNEQKMLIHSYSIFNYPIFH